MKQNLKKITLLFITAMLLGSCEKDEIYEKRQNSKETKVKTKFINFNEFKKDKKTFHDFLNFQDEKKTTNRNSNSDFTINTDRILVMERGNYKSYTFNISRNHETNYLENYIISYKNNTVKHYIARYNIDETENEKIINNEYVDLSNKTEISNLDNVTYNGPCDPVVLSIVPDYDDEGNEIGSIVYYFFPCSNGTDNGEGTGNGGSGGGGSNDDWSNNGNDDDFWSGGGNNNGNDFGNPFSGGGSGGGSADGDPFASPSQDEEDEIEIITSPVPSLDKPKSTPCKELNKMSSNRKNKAALTNLQSKTNLSKEYGFSFSKNTSNGFNDPVACNASPTNPNEIKMPTGSSVIGAAHTHPLASATDVVPMFSDGDINWLFWVAQNNQTPRDKKVYEEFFLTLTVPQGTYAIKIKDWAKFAAFRGNKAWKNIDGGLGGELYKLRHKYNKIGANGNHNRMINAFLEILQEFDAGIGLYEANSDLSNWSELVLAPDATSYNGNEPRKIPCQ